MGFSLADESHNRRTRAAAGYIVDQQAQMHKEPCAENLPNPLSIFRTTALWIAARSKFVVQWLLVVQRVDNADVVTAGWII